MNLRDKLSVRFHIEDIREVLHFIQDDERLREEIYQLMFDEDDTVSYQALWTCTHFSKEDVEWLSQRQNELIDAALTCQHSGKNGSYNCCTIFFQYFHLSIQRYRQRHCRWSQ